LVLYGDSFLPIDFSLAIDKFEKSNLPSMMTIFKNDGNWDNSNVYFDADRMLYDKSPTHELANKMNFIDYGLLAFKKDVIETRVPKGLKVDLAQLLHDLSVEGRLQGYEVFQRFYEIGSPQGHSDFEYWLKSQDLSWIN
jgi:NDP-sugar pyrophosphorylase family protein